MGKHKQAYQWLVRTFYVYVACLITPFLRIDLSGAMSAAYIGTFIISNLTYLYFLGIVVGNANKSIINWVGGAFFFGPFGIIVSHFRFKTVAIRQGWC